MKMKFCLSLGLALILAGCVGPGYYGEGYYGDGGYPFSDQGYYYDYPYYPAQPYFFQEPYSYYNYYSTPYVNPYHQYHNYKAQVEGGHEQHFQPGGESGFKPGGGGSGGAVSGPAEAAALG
ncbi:MAG: hypothetical protein WB948_09615, partial [Desulfobaccales bacterium]